MFTLQKALMVALQVHMQYGMATYAATSVADRNILQHGSRIDETTCSVMDN